MVSMEYMIDLIGLTGCGAGSEDLGKVSRESEH